MPIPIAAITAGAAIGTAASNLFGGIFQNSANRSAVAQQLRNQKELNLQQYELNRQLYYDAFNNEYRANSPLAQKNRLYEAGLNPYMVMGGQGQGVAETSVGAQSVNGGSAPSPIPAVNPFSVIPQTLVQLAQAYNSVQSGRGAGINADIQEQAKSDILRKMGFEADSMQNNTTLQNLQIAADALYKIPQMQADLNKTFEEITNLQVGRSNMAADTLLKQAEIRLKDAMSKLTGIQAETAQKQLPLFLENLRQSIELVKQQQQTEKTKQASNIASANQANSAAALNRAYKATEDVLRDPKKRKLAAEAGINEDTLNLLNNTRHERIMERSTTANQTKIMYDMAVETYEQLLVQGEYQEASIIAGMLGQLAGAIGNLRK